MAGQDYGAQVQQGTQAGMSSIDANTRTNQSMMEKIWGGYGLQAPDFYAHSSGDIANEGDVVKQNFAAKMAEEGIRAQLHQQYTNMMWRQLKYQQKQMRMQQWGSIIGAGAGLIGGVVGAATAQKSPSDMNTEELGNAGLLDPETGMLKDESQQKTAQKPSTWSKMGKGLSGIGKSVSMWDQNDLRQYQTPMNW